MKGLNKKMLSAAVLVCVLGMEAAVFAAPVPPKQPAGYDNAGVQLNKTREYIERQRVARQIQEDKAKKHAQVEGTEQGSQQESQSAVKFKLNNITTDKSEVLSVAAIEEITREYIGKEISIKDLYKIVEKINDKYNEAGYMTCRAVLAPQTIKKGVVHISLIEGRTGRVMVQGNETTRTHYITDRMSLEKGEVNSIKELNKDLLRFNAGHDVQLRIAMHAGVETGTTDYIITALEPQQHTLTVYGDNAGSDTSGLWRGGIFYNDRSLTGIRDNLSLGTMLSEGTKVFTASYLRNVGRSGTKLGVNYSANSVKMIDGDMKDLNVKGHSSAYGVQLIQPLVVTERTRTEAMLEYGVQNSQTDFMNMHWVDDTTKGASASYSVTNYGNSSIVYQKHGYRFGDFENIKGEGKDFGKYIFNGMYQKAYTHGQMLSARLDGQWSSNKYLSGSEQFYIGGMNSVRGYKESILGGDHGYAASVEYTVPFDEKRTTSAFVFFDYGEVMGDSAFEDHVLAGTGVGLRSSVTEKVFLSTTLGVPLRRDLNGTKVSKTRIHCILNGQF